MTDEKKPKDNKIVIEGVTPQGDKFRPSDWAERMSGKLATFKNRRIHYSPLLQPSVSKDGYKCVQLDPNLKTSNPTLYESIIEFARANDLKLYIDEDDCPDKE
jgi:hypothetical protein